ncbi:segregation and condensation protein B [Nonomuraea polychroma]|uniref:Segregation and condensation protein B n=1 Tax=Nonomuraea polychroma TaxID=46176 RepID=A0A438M291_9ACTN|nr:segregation and condensation protein B [Nonomuraea polychroma]
MTDNPNPLPNPRQSPDSGPPLPAWMTLPGSLVQPSPRLPGDDTPAAETDAVSEDAPVAEADAVSEDAPVAEADAVSEDAPVSGVEPDVVAPAAEPDADPSATVPEAASSAADAEADSSAVIPEPRFSGAGSAEPGATGAAGGAGEGEDAGLVATGASEDDGAQASEDDGAQASVDDGAQASEESAGGPTLEAALEAILLIVDEPVAEVTLAQVLERPTHEVAAALRGLAAEYTAAGRGFDLREVAGGWRFYTRADCAPLVERFVRDGQQTRLTQAALETLAVVAYRQPVSRARVAAVRGVNSDGVMRTLVARGLVEEAGTDPESQAVLYRTSSYFLERLGLRDLSELPELAPFLPDDVENLEETTK